MPVEGLIGRLERLPAGRNGDPEAPIGWIFEGAWKVSRGSCLKQREPRSMCSLIDGVQCSGRDGCAEQTYQIGLSVNPQFGKNTF